MTNQTKSPLKTPTPTPTPSLPPTPNQTNPASKAPTQTTPESLPSKPESTPSMPNGTNDSGAKPSLVMSNQTTKTLLKKPKKLPPLPPNENEKDFDSEVDEIPVTIQSHKTEPKKGFFAGIIENAKETIEDSGPEVQTPKRGRGRPKKDQPVDMQEDFTNLLAGLLAFGLAAAKMPPEVSPDETELTGVSHYAVRILLRHFPLNNAMSADTLDLIGIFSILASWYTRVAPYMAQTKKPKTQQSPAPAPVPAQEQEQESIPYSGDLSTELFLGKAIQNRNGHNG